MKQLIKRCVIPLTFTALATPALADHNEENSTLQDAWLDGKLGTVVIFNEHLNPFKLETAIVTGKVDSSVQKNLMTELAMSIEGIEKVDDRLVVVTQHAQSEEENENSGAVSTMLDASISTAISTKLLLKPEIDSPEIDVDTNDQTITLNGAVVSEVQSDLVEKIALNTFEVDKVVNRLQVSN